MKQVRGIKVTVLKGCNFILSSLTTEVQDLRKGRKQCACEERIFRTDGTVKAKAGLILEEPDHVGPSRQIFFTS